MHLHPCDNCGDACPFDPDLAPFGRACCSAECANEVIDDAAFEERCGRWFDVEEAIPS